MLELFTHLATWLTYSVFALEKDTKLAEAEPGAGVRPLVTRQT